MSPYSICRHPINFLAISFFPVFLNLKLQIHKHLVHLGEMLILTYDRNNILCQILHTYSFALKGEIGSFKDLFYFLMSVSLLGEFSRLIFHYRVEQTTSYTIQTC